MSKSFFSVKQFVDYINEHKQQVLEYGNITGPFAILGCSIYFEPNESFKNKFNKECIKPIAIRFNGVYKSFIISHQKVIDLFNKQQPKITFYESYNRKIHQPKITFCESYNRKINKNASLEYLNISFEQKEYKGQPYYPAEIYTVITKQTKTNILNHKVIMNKDNNEKDDVEFIE